MDRRTQFVMPCFQWLRLHRNPIYIYSARTAIRKELAVGSVISVLRRIAAVSTKRDCTAIEIDDAILPAVDTGTGTPAPELRNGWFRRCCAPSLLLSC